jgi:DNA-binding XRE family transcriptional regulator
MTMATKAEKIDALRAEAARLGQEYETSRAQTRTLQKAAEEIAVRLAKAGVAQQEIGDLLRLKRQSVRNIERRRGLPARRQHWTTEVGS